MTLSKGDVAFRVGGCRGIGMLHAGTWIDACGINSRYSDTGDEHGWAMDASVLQRSCVRDEGRPLATGLQGQVANHRMRLGSKAPVVSDTEKVL